MSQEPSFPSSPALRLRRLLYKRGLRLEPWASQEHILEAFLSHLALGEHDDAYWGELTKLASELAEDVRQRRPQSALMDAIAVDTDALMREVRAALSEMRIEPKAFRTLGTRISGSAMSLFLLVTVVAVGCGGQSGGAGSGGATTTQATGGAGSGGAATTQATGGTGGALGSTGGAFTIAIPSGGASWEDEPPQLASGAPSWGGAGSPPGESDSIDDICPPIIICAGVRFR